jgi:spore germination protein KC
MKEGRHMKGFKKAMLIFILILFPFISSGCWNYREVDKMAIAAGIAVDRDPITKDYIMTVEVVNISAQSQYATISSEIYTSKAKTMFDAVRNLIEMTGLRLFWSHAKVLIVSEEIAKEGMIPVIDWYLRDSEIRINMWLLISKGNSAGEILRNKVGINNIVSFHIDDIMKNGEVVYKFPTTNIVRFADEISGEGISASVATIRNEKIDDKIGPRVEGSAIFKED